MEGFIFFNPDDYLKFDKCFLKFKKEVPFAGKTSNIIQYITKIIINRPNDITFRFNYGFCQKYNYFFEDNFELLKDFFYKVIERDPNWDYDGKELESLCTINPPFLKQYLNELINSEKKYQIFDVDLNYHLFGMVSFLKRILMKLLIY